MQYFLALRNNNFQNLLKYRANYSSNVTIKPICAIQEDIMDNQKLLNIYKYIVEQGDTGIRAINLDGEFIVYNGKMRELEGIDEINFENHRAHEIIDFESDQSEIFQVLHSGKQLTNHKKIFWNKKNQEVTYISNIYPLLEDGEVIGAVEFARDITQIELMMYRPLRRYGAPLTFDIITAVSKVMKEVIQKARIVALSKMPVLLIGESGTGIDMIAEGIHHDLSNPNHAFINMICRRDEATILKQLEKQIIEEQKMTFFAERIEYLSISAQEHLVSLFEQHPHHDHMMIASVGKDPIDLIQEQKLSKNLYRLFSSITIYVPPLRERKEDIMPFINDYFQRHRENYGSAIQALSPEVKELFLNYTWPGNLKELEALLDEMTTVITNETTIEMHLLPPHFKWKIQHVMQTDVEESSELFIVKNSSDIRPLDHYMKEVESYYITKALDFHDGNISKSAEALGIRRQSLQYRMKNFQIDAKQFTK